MLVTRGGHKLCWHNFSDSIRLSISPCKRRLSYMKTLSYVKWYKNISNDIFIYHWCHFLEKRQENGWTNHPVTAHKWCKCTNTCLPKPIFQQPSNFINSSLQKNAKPPSKRKTGHSPANLGDSRGLPTGWRNASPRTTAHTELPRKLSWRDA